MANLSRIVHTNMLKNSMHSEVTDANKYPTTRGLLAPLVKLSRAKDYFFVGAICAVNPILLALFIESHDLVLSLQPFTSM